MEKAKPYSDEWRKKISETMKRRGIRPKKPYVGEPWNKGMKMSEEFRERCRRAQKGKKLSKETKKKMSNAKKGMKIPRKVLEASIESRKKGMSPMKPEHKLNIAKGVVDSLQNGTVEASNWKTHHYKGIVFRSSWEKKVAEWLDKNNYEWSYEGKENIIVTAYGPYIPDFTLKGGEIIEVKHDFNRVNTQDKKIQWCVDEGYRVYLVDSMTPIELKEWKQQQQIDRSITVERLGGTQNC